MDHFDDLVFIGVLFLIIGAIYIAPTFVAFRRNHPNRWVILVINVAFGGTIIGWGVAMAWAMRAAHRIGAMSSGGESGLNLFVNDVKKIQIVDPRPRPATSPVQELERLHDLLVRGAISQVEFDSLKAKLLGATPSR
ncbi:superinfection immunity protein [Bradyrhizobium genosp. A]|uniref:superinfection immunity protein n=1 Tax=Bradyrhizobium genosp. A TaxID=83626 RepID=UPI003CE8F6A9